jgi:hypothetical protein
MGKCPPQRFSTQWRDERVRPEMVALGFEAPEQMGSLFMADAKDLAALTAGVPRSRTTIRCAFPTVWSRTLQEGSPV